MIGVSEQFSLLDQSLESSWFRFQQCTTRNWAQTIWLPCFQVSGGADQLELLFPSSSSSYKSPKGLQPVQNFSVCWAICWIAELLTKQLASKKFGSNLDHRFKMEILFVRRMWPSTLSRGLWVRCYCPNPVESFAVMITLCLALATIHFGCHEVFKFIRRKCLLARQNVKASISLPR